MAWVRIKGGALPREIHGMKRHNVPEDRSSCALTGTETTPQKSQSEEAFYVLWPLPTRKTFSLRVQRWGLVPVLIPQLDKWPWPID